MIIVDISFHLIIQVSCSIWSASFSYNPSVLYAWQYCLSRRMMILLRCIMYSVKEVDLRYLFDSKIWSRWRFSIAFQEHPARISFVWWKWLVGMCKLNAKIKWPRATSQFISEILRIPPFDNVSLLHFLTIWCVAGTALRQFVVWSPICCIYAFTHLHAPENGVGL